MLALLSQPPYKFFEHGGFACASAACVENVVSGFNSFNDLKPSAVSIGWLVLLALAEPGEAKLLDDELRCSVVAQMWLGRQ